VIGWTEAQFDPSSVDSIARAITRALSDKGFREKLKAHGIKQSKLFSWNASAQKAMDGLEDLVDQSRTRDSVGAGMVASDSLPDKIAGLRRIGSLSDETLLEVSRCIELNRYQLEICWRVASRQTSHLRMGWVSTWNTRCGIASYSQFTIEQLPVDVAIFAPETDWTISADTKSVKRCWRVGQKEPLFNLLREVRAANIEVLVIQFNYGFFDFKCLNSFLRAVLEDGIRVLVTFHSTTDPSEDKRLIVISALAECHALFVHSRADIKRLRELKYGRNAAFLPQGIIEKEAAEVNYSKAEHSFVIATYGFALPGKGLEQVVDAFLTLAVEMGHLRLLMVNAEYPAFQSAALIEEIERRVLKSGFADRVTIVSEYLSDEKSLGFLKLADLVIYAYQNSGESSSAAVRMGLASTTPVAVTPVPVFDDVHSSVFRLPGLTAEDIALGIREFLLTWNSSDEYPRMVQANALLLRRSHSFAGIARYLFEIAIAPASQSIANHSSEFSFTQNSNKLSFAADAHPFLTKIGRGMSGSIVTTNRAGYLLYGPFISVAQGSYRAIVKGKVGTSGTGVAGADVAIQSGTNVLMECEVIQASHEGSLANLSFTVPEGGCADLEIRVKVDEFSELSISSVELLSV
jgi:glycosyltransferase involved in cell wall biosynthesis